MQQTVFAIIFLVTLAVAGDSTSVDSAYFVENKGDTLSVGSVGDTLAADSSEVEASEPLEIASEPKVEKLKIVRRKYKYKNQVRAALGMMAFFVIVLTTTQSWNPD